MSGAGVTSAGFPTPIEAHNMAIYSTITCLRCGKESEEVHNGWERPPDVCKECRSDAKDRARETHLSELSKQELQQRVAWLEGKVYDLERMLESVGEQMPIGRI